MRKGRNLLEPMKSQEQQMLAREPDWRLCCRAIVGPLSKDEEMVIRLRPDLNRVMETREEWKKKRDQSGWDGYY